MTQSADDNLRNIRQLLQAAEQPGTPDEKARFLIPMAELFRQLDERITVRFDFPAQWEPARLAWIGPRRQFSTLRGRNVVYIAPPGTSAFVCTPYGHKWLDEESDRTACLRCHSLRLVYEGGLGGNEQFIADREP